MTDRLTNKDSVVVGNSLGKIANHHRTLLASLTDGDEEGAAQAEADLRVCLGLWANDLKRLEMVGAGARQEFEQSENAVLVNAEKENELRKEIEELKRELVAGRESLVYKLEYEASCRLVNDWPSLLSTNKEINTIKKKFDRLKEGGNKQDERIELKEKQFQLLLQVIEDLKQNLDE